MRLLVLAFALFVISASPAVACSMKEGYRTPSNFDLVQKAKLIVLARVTQVPPMTEGMPEGEVKLEPLQFLKGAAPAEPLTLMGFSMPVTEQGVPTPTTLFQSHFSAGMGACIRMLYKPGEIVVAMFDDDPDMKKISGRTYNQMFAAFARVVETVEGPDDPWVETVRRYVALAAGPESTLRDRMTAAAAAADQRPSPGDQATAADLRRQLDPGKEIVGWSEMAMPGMVAAGVPGRAVSLFCVAGYAPALLVEGGQAGKVEIDADGQRFLLDAPVAEGLRDFVFRDAGDRKGSLHGVADPDALLQTLRAAYRKVAVVGNGHEVAAAPPLDALFRWSNQCARLRTLPVPQ